MTAFIAIATVLVVIALGWLLWPLLRGQHQSSVERHVANASIYRDAVVGVDQEAADPVIELSAETPLLRGEEPAVLRGR